MKLPELYGKSNQRRNDSRAREVLPGGNALDRKNAEPWLEPDSFMYWAVRGDQAVRTFDGVYVFWCPHIHVEQKTLGNLGIL